MAPAGDFTEFANLLLAPQLHLVVGSTPESIRDEILKSAIMTNKEMAQAFALCAIVAAATVKKATEAFVNSPSMALARQAVMQCTTLNGSVNMSALVLFGHCLLTSDYISDVAFVKAFRTRLGQHDLWAGNLVGGSTSERRKPILLQHKERTNAESAKAFGNGFFKVAHIKSEPLTAAESKFWGITSPKRSPSPDAKAAAGSPAGSSTTPHATQVKTSTQGSYIVPADIDKYVRTALHWNTARIEKEVVERTVPGFETAVRALIKSDPEMKGAEGTKLGKK